VTSPSSTGLRSTGLKPRPGILDIKAYVGGESSLKGNVPVIKLSSNEGALGPIPRALAAYSEAAATLHRYPDGGHALLRQAIAKRYALDAAQIVCGAGSDDLIVLLARAYVGPGDEVVYSRHGFLMYPIATQSCGGTPVVADEVDLTTSVDEILSKVNGNTRIVYIANPNNPTGTYLNRDELHRLRRGLPQDVLLVIDEAYGEFVTKPDYASGIELVNNGQSNTVVTRTFSKIFGLGGIRLGWAYCPPEVADILNRIRNPFNVSVPALKAGVAAIEDVEYLELCKAHNEHWLGWLTERIHALGLETTPSVCNFVLVHFPPKDAEMGSGLTAQAADQYLRSKGIIVRAMASYGLPDWLRMTVGKAEENTMLIQSLTEFVKGAS
jgi:histidinol-phosphate aminotransferase